MASVAYSLTTVKKPENVKDVPFWAGRGYNENSYPTFFFNRSVTMFWWDMYKWTTTLVIILNGVAGAFHVFVTLSDEKESEAWIYYKDEARNKQPHHLFSANSARYDAHKGWQARVERSGQSKPAKLLQQNGIAFNKAP